MRAFAARVLVSGNGMPRIAMLLLGFALIGCAEAGRDRPRLTQAQELCRSWGYAPDDPVCLRTFRRDAP